jgi:hypothetical protein
MGYFLIHLCKEKLKSLNIIHKELITIIRIIMVERVNE